MKNGPRILIVIPCYNEEKTIASVVEQIAQCRSRHDLNLDILVVNDCSRDNTLARIQELDCMYLDLPINLGIGGAMHSGYRFAHRHGYDIAVQVDGDGQHPADKLPVLLAPLLNDEADIVIGSRFLNRVGFQSTFARRAGIGFFMYLNWLLIGQTIRDSTSGFRAMNGRTLAIVDRYYPDEYPEPEAIVQFGLHKLRILEVPVEMLERQGGVSSISSLNSIYYMMKVTLGSLFIFLRLKNSSRQWI
jgi:glycosyltransferase involved in cell wall biosynthesis